ncbi:MAG: PEP-CTERM sorting domain-containing protein [Planctomycetota bacterium]|nr:PEP-CTERM sorting domain-containing protein [Planctomycetota bacterium]
MLRTRFLFLAVAVTSLFALPCTAGTITFGPYPDFAGWVYQTSSITLPTMFDATVHIPLDGTIHITVPDRITVRVTRAVPVFVPSYVRIKIFGDPQIEDPLSFFDIYAQDLDPVNPGTRLTGFNATNPELIPLTAETFIGVSGTEYPAPVQAVYLADLPFVVPDFDLSAFAGGSPTSIVYLAGPGNIPLRDVPEPTTLGLLVLGGLAVMRRKRT